MSLAIGDPTNVIQQISIPTTTPSETLPKVIAQLKAWKIDTLGIACFGPVDLDKNSPTYGYITSTPKPHWGMTDIVGLLKQGLAKEDGTCIPVGFTTDVNAAAMAEMGFGKHGYVHTHDKEAVRS